MLKFVLQARQLEKYSFYCVSLSVYFYLNYSLCGYYYLLYWTGPNGMMQQCVLLYCSHRK